MHGYMPVLVGAIMVMAVGTVGWAAETAHAPAAPNAATQPSTAPAVSTTPEVIPGTIAALDLKHPVAPTVTVRRADGRLIKVRVDANLTFVSEGQASSQLGMVSRVRLDQPVTVTAMRTNGILTASLIKINSPRSPSASTPSSPAASSRPTR